MRRRRSRRKDAVDASVCWSVTCFGVVDLGPGSSERWQVRSAGYVFDVLDPDGREILTYHWHPEAAGPDYAHLYLSGKLAPLDAGQGYEPIALGELHLPTDLNGPRSRTTSNGR